MTTTTAALGLASLATLAVLAVAASTLHGAAIGHLIVCCVYKQCEEKKINF
jgi:hypothetical protein